MKNFRLVASAAAVAVLTGALAGCGLIATPSGDPDAVGTVMDLTVSGEITSVLFAPDLGYEYFEGTTFVVGPDVNVVSETDLTASELVPGDRIAVWTDMCAESFPVQCAVTDVLIHSR